PERPAARFDLFVGQAVAEARGHDLLLLFEIRETEPGCEDQPGKKHRSILLPQERPRQRFDKQDREYLTAVVILNVTGEDRPENLVVAFERRLVRADRPAVGGEYHVALELFHPRHIPSEFRAACSSQRSP